jgi:hypothetical protein
MAAHKVAIEGTVNSKPITPELKTKVQNALKSAVESELSIRPPFHIEITHIDITFDKV